MLPLDDPRWDQFEGGYRRMKSDASPLLKQLEKAQSKRVFQEVLEKLYQDLYHQGDVGMASYLAVPHLIRIEKEKQLGDWRILGLIVSIEVARHAENPPLQKEFESDYFHSFEKISEIISLQDQEPWSRTYTACALAAIAVARKQIEMARIILELEDPDLTQKFEDFFRTILRESFYLPTTPHIPDRSHAPGASKAP